MKSQRLFFAVNLPQRTREEISEKLLREIPKEKWRKVKPENFHITLRFLGYMPSEAIERLERQVEILQNLDCFEIELTGIGHFKNRVLWLGIGKGSQELGLLSRKLCSALSVPTERFHAHVTLARNRGSGVKETSELIEKLRGIGFKKKVFVESVELMESILHASGPEYKRVFSVKLRR